MVASRCSRYGHAIHFELEVQRLANAPRLTIHKGGFKGPFPYRVESGFAKCLETVPHNHGIQKLSPWIYVDEDCGRPGGILLRFRRKRIVELMFLVDPQRSVLRRDADCADREEHQDHSQPTKGRT